MAFKLLMELVQVNSEGAITYLLNCIDKMDAKNFDGENITNVVAQIRGAYNRLRMVSFGTANSSVPPSFYEKVMDVLQTTSTPVFNSAFDYKAICATGCLTGNVQIMKDIDTILATATSLYNELFQGNDWLGKENKANETAFQAEIDPSDGQYVPAPTKRKCFNCDGDDHFTRDCPEPRNEALLKKNLDEWRANRDH